MKVYGYAIPIPYDNEPHIVSFTRELPGNTGMIGKVQKNIVGTDFKYLVYLTEDDKTKAMSLIKQTIQEELNDLYNQINLRNEFLELVCRGVKEEGEV